MHTHHHLVFQPAGLVFVHWLVTNVPGDKVCLSLFLCRKLYIVHIYSNAEDNNVNKENDDNNVNWLVTNVPGDKVCIRV